MDDASKGIFNIPLFAGLFRVSGREEKRILGGLEGSTVKCVVSLRSERTDTGTRERKVPCSLSSFVKSGRKWGITMK